MSNSFLSSTDIILQTHVGVFANPIPFEEYDLVCVHRDNRIPDHCKSIIVSKLSNELRICSCRITEPIITTLQEVISKPIDQDNPEIITAIISISNGSFQLKFVSLHDRVEESNLQGTIICWSNEEFVIEAPYDCKVIMVQIKTNKI